LQGILGTTILAVFLALPNYLHAALTVALGATVFLLLRLAIPLSVMKKPFTVGVRKKPGQSTSR
jgi:hypothetical protein